MKTVALERNAMKKSLLLFSLAMFIVLRAGFADSAVFNIGPGDVAGLIDAINTANVNGEDNTINLAAGIYTLTEIDNGPGGLLGANGLPVISGNITIRGQGEISTIIQRELGFAEP